MLLSRNPLSVVPKVEAKNLQSEAVGFQPVDDQYVHSKFRDKPPPTQTPTGSGMFQRTASLREKA